MKRAISLLLILTLLSGLCAMSVFAAAGDTYSLTDAAVTVDGSADQTVQVNLVATNPGTVYGFQGQWATADGEGKLTLSELTPGAAVSGITENSAASGNVLWLDSGFSNGIAVAAAGTIWTAAYTVDKDTPSGEYTVSLDVTSIIKDSNKGDKGIGTLTATVTVTNAAPDPSASPYTVSIVRDGEGKVYAGDSVDMKVVVSGAAYEGLEATVTYDTALFAYSSAAGAADVTDLGSGSVRLSYVGAGLTDGAAAATLTFTAQDPTATADGAFGFSYAKASSIASALTGSGDSAKTGTSVTVTKQYSVKFYEQDGTTLIDSEIKVDAGASLASIPTAPTVEHNGFLGWSDGTDTYSAAEILAMSISSDLNFTATYAADTYAVTLGEGLTGAAAATYGVAYTGRITGYDPASFIYTVTYAAGTGAEKTVDTIAADGTFTIPGGDITGALTVTVTKAVNAVVEVHADYVTGETTGYTLITVSSTGTAYSYDGSAMYFLSNKNQCAWLVEGAVTQAEAKSRIGFADAHAATLTVGADVNNDGTVDIDDAVAVYGCYNLRYDVSGNMAVYLRANVSNTITEYKVNAEDWNAILTDDAYVK